MLRLAALMHDVGKPKTRRFEPGGGVSFHHHEVVGAKLTRGPAAGAAVPEGRDRGRVPAGRAAPAVPRLRHRRVDRLRGTPVRHRRRPAARPAAQADPLGLHDPQPAQGGGAARAPTTTSRSGSPGCASRRSSTRSGPTSTATRSWRSSASRPVRWSGGRGGTSRRCASTRARSPRSRRGRAARLVGRPARSRPRDARPRTRQHACTRACRARRRALRGRRPRGRRCGW